MYFVRRWRCWVFGDVEECIAYTPFAAEGKRTQIAFMIKLGNVSSMSRMPELRVTPVVALAKEEQPLSTYLGLIEDPIVVGIISEGFLDAPCRTGNIAVGNWPDLDRHTVDGSFWTLRWSCSECTYAPCGSDRQGK